MIGYPLGDFTGVIEINGGAGGTDKAYVYDSTGSDTFIAEPGEGAVMQAGTGYRVVSNVIWTEARSENGGTDTATWTGSDAADTFILWNTGGQLVSDGYTFRAVTGYSSIEATAVSGGYDQATFYDTSGNDSYDFYPTYTESSTAGSTDGKVNDFDKVMVYATQGGTDDAYMYGAPIPLEPTPTPGLSSTRGTIWTCPGGKNSNGLKRFEVLGRRLAFVICVKSQMGNLTFARGRHRCSALPAPSI